MTGNDVQKKARSRKRSERRIVQLLLEEKECFAQSDCPSQLRNQIPCDPESK